MFKRFTDFINKSVALSCLVTVVFLANLSPLRAIENQLENGANLDLFGIGIHQEKRNDIYIGALLAENEIKQTDQLLDTNVSKRMSLKFVAKYSNRQMARLWKQRIAMNNPKSKWRPLTREIVQFSNIFKRPMQEGDEINIDYIANVGTKVYLNKTLFLTVSKLDFFDLLLNIWIGSIPPTEAFKVGITGNNTAYLNDQLTTRFDSLETEIGRFDADKVALKPVTKVAVASKPKKKKKIIRKLPAKKEASVKKKSVQKAKPKVAPKTKPVSKSVAETQKLVNDLRADLPSTRTVVEKPHTDFKNLFNNDSGTKQQNKTKSTTKPTVIKQAENQPQAPQKVAKLEQPEEEFFDADLFSGSYTQDLINVIRQYQSYPKKALAAGVEGNATVLVKIDSQGELISNKLTSRSGSRILDRAVLRMVRKAAPFPKIPKELNTEEFEFEVPMNFKLSIK